MPTDQNLTKYVYKIMRISIRIDSNDTFHQRTMILSPNIPQPESLQESMEDDNITEQSAEKERVTLHDLELLPSIIEGLEQHFSKTVETLNPSINSHNSPNSYKHLTKDTPRIQQKMENNNNQESLPVDFIKSLPDNLRNKYREHGNSSRTQQSQENENVCEESSRYITSESDEVEKCHVSSTVQKTYNQHSKETNIDEKEKKVRKCLKEKESEKEKRAQLCKIGGRVQADINIAREKECRKFDKYLRTCLVDSVKSKLVVEQDDPSSTDEAAVFKWLHNKKLLQVILGRGLLTCTLMFGYYLDVLCDLVKAQRGKKDRWRNMCRQLNIPSSIIRKYRALGKIAHKYKKMHQLNMSVNVLYKNIQLIAQMLTFEDISKFWC